MFHMRPLRRSGEGTSAGKHGTSRELGLSLVVQSSSSWPWHTQGLPSFLRMSVERSPSQAAKRLRQSSPSGNFLDPEEALRSQLWQAGTPALHALVTSFSIRLTATSGTQGAASGTSGQWPWSFLSSRQRVTDQQRDFLRAVWQASLQ